MSKFYKMPRQFEMVLGMKASLHGDAENARHEIAGHENAAPDCKGGKCET